MPHRLIASDPLTALARAAEVVPKDTPADNLPLSYDLDLVRFLREVPLKSAEIAQRVTALAHTIRAKPLREEILVGVRASGF